MKIKFYLKILFLLFYFSFFITYADELDKKIAQMIIIGFNGNSVYSSGFKKVLRQIKKGEISGVIFFEKNIKSKKDLIKMNEKILSSSNITPFIAIDNEGGYIQRYNFNHYKSAKQIAASNLDEAKKEYSIMADDEKELKINFNFAPCTDLEINPNSIIAKKERSYGDNPIKVSEYAEIFIKEHNKRKIITSIKHFPGHGSIEADTHKGFADSTNTFNDNELIPYFNLKDYDKLNTVMISHVHNDNFDKIYPASLSKNTVEILRSTGFQGVIVSDDYDMRAIRDNYTLREIVVNSINSGVNILLFSNNIDSRNENIAKKIRKIAAQEIKKGNIDIEKINDSYKKIINLKDALN